MAAKKTTEEVASEIREKFGENIHIVGEYLGAQKNITLGCNFGHTWEVLATNLLSRGTRSTCNECNLGNYQRRITWTQENLKILQNYASLNMPLSIISNKMGVSEASITNTCARYDIARPKVLGTLQKLCTKLIEQNREIVSDIDAINSGYEKLIIRCAQGHEHEQLINNIINHDTDCPSCFFAKGVSRGELEVLDFIRSIYSGPIIEHSRSILSSKKELDLVLPELGLAFEYDGTWFHREDRVGKKYHLDKTEGAAAKGLMLIHIYEDEWIKKKDIVKSRIRALLNSSFKIYARNCTIKEIDYPSVFLEENHLQGKGSPTSINYGLFYLDELVQVITFAKSRFDNKYDYELVRLCGLTGITIVGGASKLFKYFASKYPTNSIISYSDRRWGNGKVYQALGFTKSNTGAPGYRYYKRLESYSRFKFQKAKLKGIFPDLYDENLSEPEIMKLAGFHRVFDSGNDIWIYPPIVNE